MAGKDQLERALERCKKTREVADAAQRKANALLAQDRSKTRTRALCVLGGVLLAGVKQREPYARAVVTGVWRHASARDREALKSHLSDVLDLDDVCPALPVTFVRLLHELEEAREQAAARRRAAREAAKAVAGRDVRSVEAVPVARAQAAGAAETATRRVEERPRPSVSEAQATPVPRRVEESPRPPDSAPRLVDEARAAPVREGEGQDR